MKETPMASRKHIAIFGETNAGKSSLFNAILGQDMSIVSQERGTTTDPVSKAMELIPFGPVVLIDTAGLNDDTVLGEQRTRKALAILERADLALYTADINAFNRTAYEAMKEKFDKYGIPHILVFTKRDTAPEKVEELKALYPGAFFTEVGDARSIEDLKAAMGKLLEKSGAPELPLLGDLVPPGGVVVCVVPIDSAAPKGRIILPQVQAIRDCLDHGIISVVARDTELELVIRSQTRIDLVVTDSQAFRKVNEIVPMNVPLVSFSMLMARQKGDLGLMLEGVKAVESLRDGSKILMAEACTHTTTHEDIGRVQIPEKLRRLTGKELVFEFFTGYDFPEDLSGYDLVVHCGACMINRRTVVNRIMRCREQGVPITNYGVLLAYLSGVAPQRFSLLAERLRK